MQTRTIPEINHLELAETARIMKGWSRVRIEHVFERANQRFSVDTRELTELITNLSYSGIFLTTAKIPYDDPDTTLIRAAIAEYLLTH